MIRIPDNARAANGRPIDQAFLNLERFVKGLEAPLGGPGIRMKDYGDEVIYYAPGKRPHYPVRFQVSASGTEARVGKGTVNTESPRMGVKGLDLNGTDLEGNEEQGRPVLQLDDRKEIGSDPGPGPGLKSFVCVRILIDPATGEQMKEARPEDWLKIVHRHSLPRGFHSGAAAEIVEEGVSFGYWPLAILYWNATGSAVRKAANVVHFDLIHQYFPGTGKDPGLHVCL